MRTEDLIVDLARQSGPWTPLAPVRVRLTRWLVLAIGLGVVTVAVIGARADFADAIQRPTFVALAVATLASGLLAAQAALVLSVPGAERTPLVRVLAAIGKLLIAVLTNCFQLSISSVAVVILGNDERARHQARDQVHDGFAGNGVAAADFLNGLESAACGEHGHASK